jgi:HD-GYP domain-containing protein (c-di-GMP phosphodiesterase class II)
MSGKFCAEMEQFAPMHDIGKVGIPDSILLAPRKLTAEEFAEMKRHTVLGHSIVSGNPEMELAAQIILSHHEKWDGSGYPAGLRGDAIPLPARIAAIADVYDALRSKRPYKTPWPHGEAAAMIAGNAGIQFDPTLVEVFLRLGNIFENVYRELKD